MSWYYRDLINDWDNITIDFLSSVLIITCQQQIYFFNMPFKMFQHISSFVDIHEVFGFGRLHHRTKDPRFAPNMFIITLIIIGSGIDKKMTELSLSIFSCYFPKSICLGVQGIFLR